MKKSEANLIALLITLPFKLLALVFKTSRRGNYIVDNNLTETTKKKKTVIDTVKAEELGYQFAWIEGPVLREGLFLITNLLFPVLMPYYLVLGAVFLVRRGGMLTKKVEVLIRKSDKRYNMGYRIDGYKTEKELIRVFSLTKSQSSFLKFKGVAFILFSIFYTALYISWQDEETVDTEQGSIEKIEARQREDAREHQLDSLLSLADSLNHINHISKAVTVLDSALQVAQGIEKENIVRKQGWYNHRRHKYKLAVDNYNELINDGYSDDSLRYQRALSLVKLNQYQEAVDDLRIAIKRGDEKAVELYEEINPEKKRLVRYLVRCCDGTVSYSKSRRGTCSHHGGVCNWREPVYESYRKY